MTSAVGYILSAGFIHADFEVSVFTPDTSPTVSSNPVLTAPGVLQSLSLGLAESYNCHSMVDGPLFTAASS